jgi:hypothetical protein
MYIYNIISDHCWRNTVPDRFLSFPVTASTQPALPYFVLLDNHLILTLNYVFILSFAFLRYCNIHVTLENVITKLLERVYLKEALPKIAFSIDMLVIWMFTCFKENQVLYVRWQLRSYFRVKKKGAWWWTAARSIKILFGKSRIEAPLPNDLGPESDISVGLGCTAN